MRGADLEAGVSHVDDQVCGLSNQHVERRKGSGLEQRCGSGTEVELRSSVLAC